jgi:EAL domain-containing protein (putative c-di-GMP-specific phosphodiesterase class I)
MVTPLPSGLSALATVQAPMIQRFPAFSYAFQPIVNALTCQVLSYEALIRGPSNEPAFQVFEQVPADGKQQFDQDSRAVAIAQGMKLGLDCHLNLNFLPQSLHVSRESIRTTLEAADRYDLPIERIILEVTEGELISDPASFAALLNEYRVRGLKVAIDDFGAGFAGLNLLADFQPDQVKIDMHLVRGIERNGPRQAIVRAVAQVCGELGIEVIAEGVETAQEYLWLLDHGIRLFQGYLFARPGFETFPVVGYPRAV